MIKASALKLVSGENEMLLPIPSSQNMQDIKIELSSSECKIPKAVEDLSYKMMCMESSIRNILEELRSSYINKKQDFHVSMIDIPIEKKKEVIDMFKGMYGVLYEVCYCSSCDTLNGKIVYSHKAQRFITGQYLEIASRTVISSVLNELEAIYNKKFKIYNNVIVSTLDGRIKNEFDSVIENVTDSIMYVIECKSGKQFNDFDKLSRIGKEYGIVPNRLLLVDNYLTNDKAEMVEYFCDYYVTNLEGDNLKRKLTEMLKNDLEEE